MAEANEEKMRKIKAYNMQWVKKFHIDPFLHPACSTFAKMQVNFLTLKRKIAIMVSDTGK